MKERLVTYLNVIIFGLLATVSYAQTVIAIDAGHGGKDPGAIGKHLGLKEKEVTLSIAKELKALLDKDPNFKAVMTRKGDYFIPLPNRTEIARKNKANYLVSIHADSSPSSKNLKGASVWVLSNRRANDELGKWLEDHEKQSELLGGASSVLSNASERYLSQTVLDLQFSHSQRAGYELGRVVLNKINQITPLAKTSPQHASLSVLRSPDIPSILVETGFLSNATEEQKLASIGYRRQLARAIYNGLVEYRKQYADYQPQKASKKPEDKKKSKPKAESQKPQNRDNNAKKVKEKPQVDKAKAEQSTNYHIVEKGETLYSIARRYNTTPEQLSKLNNIKENKIFVGKKLKLK